MSSYIGYFIRPGSVDSRNGISVRALSVYSLFEVSCRGFSADVGGNKNKINFLAHADKMKILTI